MTETTGHTESKVPVTGSDGECYLCSDARATHVGFATLGPVGAEVGLCSDCWTMQYSDYLTSIDPTGTRNHKRITASDGSVAYTYETDDGTYHILTSDNIPSRSGPFEDSHFEESLVAGGATVEHVDAHELPAVPGDAVEFPDLTTVRAACPDCGTIATLTVDSLRAHNDRAHDGNPIARAADDLTVEDLPNMQFVPNPDQWADEFNGTVTDTGDLVNTDLHSN